jgi:hypothetical protein
MLNVGGTKIGIRRHRKRWTRLAAKGAAGQEIEELLK